MTSDFGPLTSQALNFLKDHGWDTDALARELLARDAQPLLDMLNADTVQQGTERVHRLQTLVREVQTTFESYSGGDRPSAPPAWLTALVVTADTCVRVPRPSRYPKPME